MLIIGLTGGIAAGKSSVAKELRALGIPVFDADANARAAVAPKRAGLREVVRAFGEEFLTEAGELDRAKISALVFKDKQALTTLEKILHKIVRRNLRAFLRRCKNKNQKIAVLDVPLLIETGWHELADEVWLVTVSREQQIERAMRRSGMTREAVEERIDAQLSLDEKKKFAHVLIDNSGELENTLAQVRARIEKILQE